MELKGYAENNGVTKVIRKKDLQEYSENNGVTFFNINQ